MIGQTISHYTITAKLGEGGMGVVYKATDTKLDRTVALKFLPAHVSVNEETKARFLQEAKAAAALNHAHICTIHSVEETGEAMFIVMEYIEGGTLRTKIPFPSIDDAITAAIQIGEALQEAHAKGIVHRDIKADNVMMTSKGQAKVMDFGLAKLKGSLKLTRTSSTVGTLAYMAPEQIQGGEVDTRSDIFSFGSLVFEMLAGKTPFRGEHEAAMVYSIVNEEPQPLESLRQEVPPLLSSLIQKCLEKDPADRYQHMDDIVSELRRAQKKTTKVMRSSAYVPVQPQTGTVLPSVVSQSGISAATSAPFRAPMIRYGLFATIGFIIVVGAWFLLKAKTISVNPNMTTRVLQVPFTQYSYPSLSPDGKWIAFPAADVNGKWDIYYMHVNGGEPRKITSDGTRFIQQTASISPDGSQIAYDKPSEDGATFDLFAISALGGTSRKLAVRATSGLWRPDGARVGFIRTTNIRIRSDSPFMEFWTVSGDGSDLRREFADSLFVTKGGNYRFSFCWSPDGRSIVWIRSQSSASQFLVIRELETGKERRLTDGNENIDAMAWTRDGKIIFSSNRGGNTNLWVVSANGGEASQVTKGGGPDLAVSIAASGNELVYLQQQLVGYMWIANVDGSELRQISQDEREIWEPAFSPDQKRIAFIMNDPDPLTEKSDIYVVDRDGNNRRRLTTGNPNIRIPAWSPDGRRITYTVPPTNLGSDTGKPKLFAVDADNPGAPRLVGQFSRTGYLDEDHVVTLDGSRSYISTLSSGETRRFFTDSASVWSLMDGKQLAYYDSRAATRGWWVVDIAPINAAELLRQPGDVVMPTMRGKPRKISSSPGYLARWTTSPSRTWDILQYAGNDQLRMISFSRGTDKLLPARFPGITSRSFDISDDGKEVVFVTPRLVSRLVQLENVFE